MDVALLVPLVLLAIVYLVAVLVMDRGATRRVRWWQDLKEGVLGLGDLLALAVRLIVALAFWGVALLIAVAIVMWAWRTVFG